MAYPNFQSMWPDDPSMGDTASNAWDQYVNQGWSGYNKYADRAAGGWNSSVGQPLNALGGNLGWQGYGNLLQLLRGKGKIDPKIMNSNLGAVQRDTQANQNALAGRAAGTGFQNSGVMQAIQAALGQAGVDKQADIRTKDSADAYGRNQKNLGLFQSLVTQPSIDQLALSLGQYGQDSQNRTQSTTGLMGALASILSAFV